ncbi:MAG: hypothetical protein JSS76_04735 [Bacteroidetes bacterium]|nr:hypothetical protein [Bacteroidota bacterium]MBS1684034.1 hypothetical protein [Bacteroidota bacterium]
MIIPGISSRVTPQRQALTCLGLSLIAMVICHFAFAGTATEFLAAFSGIMFYSLMNPVLSIFHESFVKYTWPSWLYYIGLLILLLLAARYISGTSIWALPEYRMMLGSIVAFYLITSIMVRVIRAIWEFAESDEG